MTQKLSRPDTNPERTQTSRIEELRDWGNLFALWRLCGRTACRRAGACRGDARACFPRNFALLPNGVRAWFAGLGQAQQAGHTFDEAVEWLDGTEAGDAFRDWHAAVAKSLGDEASLPVRWWNAPIDTGQISN